MKASSTVDEFVPVGRRVSRTLAEKEEMILAGFSQEEGSADPTLRSETAERLENHLVILFQRNNNLAEINSLRETIALDHPASAELASELTEDLSKVDPELISENEFSAGIASEQITPSTSLRYHATNSILARYLADKYEMVLVRECYRGATVFAEFEVDPTADETALANSIQSENNDFVYCIEPVYFADSMSYRPRSLDERIDDITPSGSGIDPLTCGIGTWDGAEAYWYFQSNLATAHASMWGSYPAGAPELAGATAGLFICDSGAYPDHPDLPYGNGALWPSLVKPDDPYGLDPYYWDCDFGYYPDLLDIYCHGTAVAGLAVARGGNDGIAGALPGGQAEIFLASNSVSCTEAMLKALVMIELDTVDKHCFNISQGFDDQVQVFIDFVDDLDDYNDSNSPGMLMVTSAGNSNTPVYDPATDEGWWPQTLAMDSDSIITVGAVYQGTATNPECRCVSYSNFPLDYDSQYGLDTDKLVTVSATGGDRDGDNEVLVLWANQGTLYNQAGEGTSFASPIVAGVVALVQSYAPELSAAQVKNHIHDTGRTTVWNTNTPLAPFASNHPNYTTQTTVVPIIDAGSAVPWLDIKTPSYDPAEPEEVTEIDGSTTIQIWGDQPGGALVAHRGSYNVTLRCIDSQLQEWVVGTIMGASCIDTIGTTHYFPNMGTLPVANGQLTPLSLTFDPTLPAFSGIADGPAKLVATMHDGMHQLIRSHPVNVVIDTGQTDPIITKHVLMEDVSSTSYAVGKDSAGKLYAAWTTTENSDTVYLAVENAPAGSMNFSYYVVDQDADGYSAFSDFTICDYNGSTGLLYQKRLFSGLPGEYWYMRFASLEDGQLVIHDELYDTNYQPYLFGTYNGISSLRTGGTFGGFNALRHTDVPGTDDIYLAQQIMDNIWTSTLLGTSPGSGTGLHLLTSGSDLRAGVTTGTQINYGLISTSPASISYSAVPCNTYVPGTVYQEWIGAGLRPCTSSSTIDPLYQPTVVTRQTDGYSTPQLALVSAEIGSSSSWIHQIVELCTAATGAPYKHGTYSTAKYLPDLDHVVTAYISGVDLASYPSALNTLKIGINNGNTYWTTHLVDPYNVGSMDITERSGNVVILHSAIPGGTGDNTVFLTSVEAN